MAGKFAIAVIASLAFLAGLRIAGAEPPTRAPWPHDAAPSAEYDPASGRINVAWQAAASASAYVVWWVNNNDRFDSGETRTTDTTAQLSRNGGFTNGEWTIRVRAAANGAWSKPAIVTISGAPPELALDIESSRKLCTEGTLTEIRWSATGGTGPLNLQINGEPVAELDGTTKVNCGLIPRNADDKIDESQRDAVITGFLRDGRGAVQHASIRVPRVKALPAPTPVHSSGLSGTVSVTWRGLTNNDNAAAVLGVQRYKLPGDTEWTYTPAPRRSTRDGVIISTTRPAPAGSLVNIQGAALRHQIEVETPEALSWSSTINYQVAGPPSELITSTTHDTATISWIPAPATELVNSNACRDTAVVRSSHGESWASVRAVPSQRSQVTIGGLNPDTEYTVLVTACTQFAGYTAQRTIRTGPTPASWSPLPRGPQNVRATATQRTITVQWDEPFAGAMPVYQILLSDGSTGQGLAIDGLYEKPMHGWSHTFSDLSPETIYRVRIRHHGLVYGYQDISVMTTSIPTEGATGQQNILEVLEPVEALGCHMFVWLPDSRLGNPC